MKNPSYDGLQKWLKSEIEPPNMLDKGTDKIQNFFFKVTPKQIHDAITLGMRSFTSVLISGTGIALKPVDETVELQTREEMAMNVIDKYTKLAIGSGAGIGAGGLWIGLLDLPLLMGLKVRLLYEIATIYGYKPDNSHEKLYVLYVFQTAFSNPLKRKEKIETLIHHKSRKALSETLLSEFDWLSFQREYRDYLDLAKLFQLIPGVGAVIGAVANRKLMKRLGDVAIGAYRLRYFQDHKEAREID